MTGEVPEWVWLLKYAGTAAVTVTMLTVFLFLAPSVGEGWVKTLLTGLLPPTINCTDQDPACPLNLTNQGAVRMETEAVLVDSLGFGGHNAALILKRWGK